jgi:hypothetical protein
MPRMDAGDWFVLISLVIQGAAIYAIGEWLELGEASTLLLILAAVVVIGLAQLRGQAAGLGRLIDQMGQLKEQLSDIQDSVRDLSKSVDDIRDQMPEG